MSKEVIDKLSDVLEAQTEHHGEFQRSLADVLKSHTEQIAAQVVMQQNMVAQQGTFQQGLVASNDEFQRSVAEVLQSLATQKWVQLGQHEGFLLSISEVLTGQEENQRLLTEQVRLLGEQMDSIRTSGDRRKERGTLTLKIYDGTTDADAHIVHYQSVGLTEKWSDNDKKTGFHRTLTGMALLWYERRVSTIHDDTWDILKEAFLQYFWSPTYESNWSEECLMRVQGPKELVWEYYTDKLLLIERSNPNFSEAEKVRVLHKGLRQGIIDCLMGHNHGTLSKLLKKSIAIESEG